MKTCQADAFFQETYIREVRVSYYVTDKAVFAITGPESVKDFVVSILPDNSREHCAALYLDGASEVICYSLISTGTANAATVSPREVFQRALQVGAVALVFSHNHPSGRVAPSAEDRRVTKRLQECGVLLDIKLLDHVIVSDTGYYSFQESGDL